MTRRPILVALLALIAALAVLVLVGRSVLERDREALYAAYGRDRAQDLDEAASALLAEVSDIGEDLQLAATLLGDSDTEQLADRALHAIAMIKREYLAMAARSGDRITRVIAFDAPERAAEEVGVTLDALLDKAEQRPGILHVSSALSDAIGPAAWYRVFARRSEGGGPAVAVAVDMTRLLSRLKIQRGPMLRVAVLDRGGRPAPVSDRELAELVEERPALGRALLASHSHTPTMIVGRDTARRLGLPETTAVMVSRPLQIHREGPPWTLLLVASTSTLATQEQVLVRRVLVGGGLVLMLLVLAAAYVVRNTSRAASMRERLRHVARLEHLTEKAEKILDNIPSGVLLLSEDGRVTGTNRRLGERLASQIAGKPLAEAFEAARPADIEVIAGLVRRALESREAQTLPREQLRLFGSEAWLSIHVIPLERSIADVGVLVVLDDHTQLRRIEDRLLHSEKLVTAGQLAAGIAHEVGTPLNIARGRIELALSHLGAEHPEADNHRLVIDQIDRVTRLIQQLLDYVRPTPAAMRSVDLASTMHAVRDLLDAEATQRGVTIHVDAVPGGPALHADPDQVQQILVNLVLNAIAACERGGRIDIRARSLGRSIVLEVADTGHGIPREIQAQVFDPFFTTKKRGQGTGLGLWVVAQLVRAHAGEIEIDSAPGAGTTVRITWPVA